MSEAKEKKEAAPKTKKAEAGATPAEQIAAAKKVKNAWTLKKCLKAARRFTTEDAWSAGAPASYKSAVAHGWLAQCTKEMTTRSTAKGTFKKSA